MPPTLSFVNEGEIDLRLIQYMGVNVKTTDTPIGFFGTGLKYALAILLRSGHRVRIFSGETVLNFSLTTETIRGKDFQFVCMNGQNLGITSDLGKTWELWMAFREIYSNMLDEGGHVVEAPVCPKPGTTVVEITGQDFINVWERRADYFLQSQPQYKLEGINLHRCQTSSSIFYQGILVARLAGKAYANTYNVVSPLDLTEDRTIKYHSTVNLHLGRAVSESKDPEAIRRILKSPPGTLEFDEVDYDWSCPSPEFLDVVEELGARAPKSARQCLFHHRPKDLEFEVYKPTALEQKIYAKAASILERRLDATLAAHRVEFAVDLGTNIMGRYSKGVIWISRYALTQGTKYVASTLYEEYLHASHGFVDGTCEFQTFLFNQLISLCEELDGEPL